MIRYLSVKNLPNPQIINIPGPRGTSTCATGTHSTRSKGVD
jgi:hypothetical protein